MSSTKRPLEAAGKLHARVVELEAALLAKSEACDALLAEVERCKASAAGCMARMLNAQIEQRRAEAELLALRARIEAAPVAVVEDVEIDGEVYRAAFDDDKRLSVGQRVHLLPSPSGEVSDGK